MPRSTKERLIAIGADLFYRDGFHAVGLDNILDATGVTKTTFYNHFESKEALILAVLEHHDRWWRNEFSAGLRKHGGDDPAAQLHAVFDVLADMLASETFNGCIFVNVSAEFPMPHDPVHQAAAEHKRLMEMILRDLGLRAGARDPVALAEQLSVIMEGAYVTRQVTRNPRTTEIARKLGQALFDKHLPVTRTSESSTAGRAC
jgi:AcrR family transcriptional regulator